MLQDDAPPELEETPELLPLLSLPVTLHQRNYIVGDGKLKNLGKPRMRSRDVVKLLLRHPNGVRSAIERGVRLKRSLKTLLRDGISKRAALTRKGVILSPKNLGGDIPQFLVLETTLERRRLVA